MTEEKLNFVLTSVFEKMLKSNITRIQNGYIYYNINGYEISLIFFKRSDKSEGSKPYSLSSFNKDFPYFYFGGLGVTNCDSDILDFFITIEDKQYMIPRPVLGIYCSWLETLQKQLNAFEENMFEKILCDKPNTRNPINRN